MRPDNGEKMREHHEEKRGGRGREDKDAALHTKTKVKATVSDAGKSEEEFIYQLLRLHEVLSTFISFKIPI